MSRKAFTLIELLIVVAIIGILAAIAVPNFMNAQIRAKISRVQSDQKAYSTAMDMYMLDNASGLPVQDQIWRITTPISYIATLNPDPFAPAEPGRFNFVHMYDPFYFITTQQKPNELNNSLLADFNIWCGYPNSWTGAQNDMTFANRVRYQIRSIGPNRYNEYGMRYDSTNGLMSNGDIIYFGPGRLERSYGGGRGA
ncbi:MAG: prepilin-type N-terminal cleavage/methylation domain-containing protein [bacterium]|jgi:prepilin-type N-terminal cleavage/methylation domain-containing protein|nr:prepilin-type N-terminal cleavage/methylation domain-containing protein [bacterium]